MQSEFITHNGKRIFIANYENLNFEAFEKEIKTVTETLCGEPANSVLCINNTSGLMATPKVINLFIWSVGKTKPHISKAAVVGLGLSGTRKGLMDVILKATQQTAQVFDDLEKAKDWMTQK